MTKYKAFSSIIVSYEACIIAQDAKDRSGKTQRGGQAAVEDEKEGQREKRQKGTRGKNKKRGGDKKTDGF